MTVSADPGQRERTRRGLAKRAGRGPASWAGRARHYLARVPQRARALARRRGELVQRFREDWPVIEPVTLQIGTTALFSIGISAALGDLPPIFAALFGVAVLELILARHHRQVIEIWFGVMLGLLIGSAFNPRWPVHHAALDALIGTVVALVVALTTTPSDPVTEVRGAVDPLLATMSTQVRAIASALRSADITAAGTAVYALVDTEPQLRRLNNTLAQVRRAMMLTRWRRGQDLAGATTTATEIGYAVREVRSMAQVAWWGVLREGERVPTALPQMLETMADGLAVLRREFAGGGSLYGARNLLASAAQWVAVMRAEPLGLAAGAVAKNAEQAALNLVIATGLSVEAAEELLHHPHT